MGLALEIVLGSLLGSVLSQSIPGTSYFLDAYYQNCTVPPRQCPNSNITYYLYTRGSETNPYELKAGDMANLRDAPVSKGKPFVVLIHGYTGHHDYSPNMEIRPALLRNGDYNVMSVDYGPLAQEPCYYQATINTETVGLCTAELTRSLYKAQGPRLDPALTHVIGFSLGAHVAGILAKYLKPEYTLSWLTGLDPALPMFDPIMSSPDQRLDEGDAEFVDVVHTNAGYKGKVAPCGHVDFYLNNAGSQPGCNANASCDHVRAVEYYAESLDSEDGFWGSRCTLNQASFMFGVTDSLCALPANVSAIVPMGASVPHTARGTYQVFTAPSPPFALGTYFNCTDCYYPTNISITDQLPSPS